MATAEQKAACQAFIKASRGKDNHVDNKVNKKIMTDSKMIANKYIDTTSMDISHSKIVKQVGGKGGMTIDQYCTAYATEVGNICHKKMKLSEAEAKAKFLELLASSSPEAHGATKASKVGGVDRLTDTSKYTGSHKERFDESGQGKGLAGREDKADNSGYVGNYKGAETYDKSH